MRATANGTLAETPMRFKDGAACCVVLASKGYPKAYEKGKEIDLNGADGLPDVDVFHAGTALKDNKLVTSRGRVLGVTATAATLEQAVEKAYSGPGASGLTARIAEKTLAPEPLQPKNGLTPGGNMVYRIFVEKSRPSRWKPEP